MHRFDVLIEDIGERYACAETRSLLEGMEALGRRGIPVGCRNGGCGVCKVRIESGRVRTDKMSRGHVSAAEEAAGYVLACRAYPCSDLRLSAVDKLARCIERSRTRTGFLQAALAAGSPSSPNPDPNR